MHRSPSPNSRPFHPDPHSGRRPLRLKLAGVDEKLLMVAVPAQFDVVMPLLANAIAKLSLRVKCPYEMFGTTSNVAVLLKD